MNTYCVTAILIGEEYYFSFPLVFEYLYIFVICFTLLKYFCFFYKWSSLFLFISFHWAVFCGI